MSNKRSVYNEVKKKPAEYGSYKGYPTISLPLYDEADVKFTFGLKKAELILEYIDEIQEFVEKNSE